MREEKLGRGALTTNPKSKRGWKNRTQIPPMTKEMLFAKL
jgi:hypothetical protein